MSGSKKIKILKAFCLSIFLITSFRGSLSFAEDVTPPAEEKSEEDLLNDQKNKEFENVARNDSNNLNYYPKIQFSNSDLFTGASTLKGNEIFARLGLTTFLSQGSFNNQGSPIINDKVYSYISPTLNIGFGIVDNLFFSASVPYKFYFGQSNGLSDPWVNLKLRIINEPFILSVQANGKIPLGSVSKVPPFGDGQADAGLMVLATKPFDNLFFQLGAGYKYRFDYTTLVNNVATNIKYADQLNYIADVGYNFKELGLTIDLSGNGYIPVSIFNSSSVLSANYLTIMPNITYKYNNLDFNLAFEKNLFGYNFDNGYAIHAGASYKLSFEYPKIFTLLLLPKIDPEDLDKKKDLKEVEKGRDLYINNCAKCHVMVNPDAYDFDNWKPIVDRYREKKVISKAENSAILDFLRKYTEK